MIPGAPFFTNQAIITSYKFNCCGVVTEWRAFVHNSNNSQNDPYQILFSVWRPSPVTDGCYNLIDINVFELFPLPPRGILVGVTIERVGGLRSNQEMWSGSYTRISRLVASSLLMILTTKTKTFGMLLLTTLVLSHQLAHFQSTQNIVISILPLTWLHSLQQLLVSHNFIPYVFSN